MTKRRGLFSDEGTPDGAEERPPTSLQKVLHAISGRDRRAVKRYLRDADPRMLQIGAGENLRDGWLNTNFWFPLHQPSILVDATKRLPLPDAAFDYVYSEHMIEHIDYLSGMSMLHECFRVLKPGGRLRLSTPDLAFLIDLQRPDRDPTQERYIAWAAEEFPPGMPATAAAVMNNFVRAWGHSYIYDADGLVSALTESGFTDIERVALGESQYAAFRGMDHIERMPREFIELETMAFEAVKSPHGWRRSH